MKLFDRLFGGAIDRRIAAYQNDLVIKHCEEVENIYRTMRGWRHDYHNHIQTLLALTGDGARSREYLMQLNGDLERIDAIIKTGNVMLDAILNSKLSLIKSKRISVNAKAIVPRDLKISDTDLCVIIGNLLDNAMEACLRGGEGERFIRVYIGILKRQLYISVSNSTHSPLKKSGKTFLSTKSEGAHGFGLTRVDRVAERYSGYVNRQYEEGVFATEVMLPLDG